MSKGKSLYGGGTSIRGPRGLLLLLFLAMVWLRAPAWAETDPGSRALQAATRILDQAKTEAAKDCSGPHGVLVRVLCAHRLVVGLRTYYPGFSVRDATGQFTGYEPDIAAHIAGFLGVPLQPQVVDPKNRIPLLAEGHVDLVISTMGDSVQRGAEVRFIRPHYYISQTAIVGPNAIQATGWDDFEGRTVCLPLGSNSNIDFVRHHVRVLTFDRPELLLDALRFNECTFIVQDDTFFARFLTNPGWAAQYGIRFRFAPLPWGMAVAHDGAARFAELLDALSVAYHANGVFLRIARAHALDLSFLAEEQKKFSTDTCVTSGGMPQQSCLLPPVNNADPADVSALAPAVSWLQRTLASSIGLPLDLSLLAHRSTLGLLLEGVAYSLALILGTQFSTALVALGLGRAMIGGPRFVRRGIGAFTGLAQVTPLPLLLFLLYVIAGGIGHYSGVIALITAVFAIGLYNGCNAARAIGEAHEALLRRGRPAGRSPGADATPGFWRAVSLASVQLVAFLINAAKGSPAAGMIGVPEFLNVVTDLTANSTDRVTVHLVLLIFYVSLVLIVIWGLTTMRARLAPSVAEA